MPNWSVIVIFNSTESSRKSSHHEESHEGSHIELNRSEESRREPSSARRQPNVSEESRGEASASAESRREPSVSEESRGEASERNIYIIYCCKKIQYFINV